MVSKKTSIRAFTLVEIAIVVAVIAVVAALGLVGMTEMLRVQKANAALALANLTIREQKQIALERRQPRLVQSSGSSVLIGSATFTSGTDCTFAGPPPSTVALPGVNATGSVCFDRDGFSVTAISGATTTLSFNDVQSSALVADVVVFPSGSLKWTGKDFATANENVAVARVSTSLDTAALQAAP